MVAWRTFSTALILIGALICPAASQKAPQSTPEAQGRVSYVLALRRAFLESGADMDVYLEERHDPKLLADDFKKYPRVTVYGYLNAPSVYQIITKTALLADAKAKGFKSMVFWSKDNNGRWVYDLSGPNLPSCDVSRRLCL